MVAARVILHDLLVLLLPSCLSFFLSCPPCDRHGEVSLNFQIFFFFPSTLLDWVTKKCGKILFFFNQELIEMLPPIRQHRGKDLDGGYPRLKYSLGQEVVEQTFRHRFRILLKRKEKKIIDG